MYTFQGRKPIPLGEVGVRYMALFVSLTKAVTLIVKK